MARNDLELITGAAGRLIDRIEGLSDDEYLWEPVADCWNVRQQGDGSWAGDVAADGTHFSRSTPPPFTTIAWRLWHLGASPRPTWPMGPLTGAQFVDAYFHQIRMSESPAVGTADDARALCEATWKAVAETFAGFTDEELAAPMGPTAGFFSDAPLEGLVLHVADELIHHGAEVGVVRDLYAHTSDLRS